MYKYISLSILYGCICIYTSFMYSYEPLQADDGANDPGKGDQEPFQDRTNCARVSSWELVLTYIYICCYMVIYRYKDKRTYKT